MKKQLLTLVTIFITYFACAQVGIGTTTPSNDLDVEGSGAAATAIDINNTSTGDPKINLQINGTTTFSIGIDNSDSDKLKIGTTAVETNTAITIDASQNVGVGTSSPLSTLDAQGSMGLKVSTITAATTLNSTHNVVLCNTGAYTVTLPAAASNTGRTYYIKNIDAQGDDITIDGNSSETIDGSTTYILTSYLQNIKIISDGSNWHVIAVTSCGAYVTFTYNGASVTYGTVTGANSTCWLDRNLGATQVATSSTDHLSYGDLFQWGRGADGHQLITWTNSTTATAVNGTTATLSTTDTPGNALFITNNTPPLDWRNPQNDNLWQGVSGTNNPCPSGYRLPTSTELNAEFASWGTQNEAGAFASPLKLTMPGRRAKLNGSFVEPGNEGYYWSSEVGAGTASNFLIFNTNIGAVYPEVRAFGFSVRCIKD